MPRKVNIKMTIFIDDDGELDKFSASKKPHADKDGDFTWKIKNDVGRKIKVDLTDFDPPDYLEITSTLPIDIPKDKVGLINAVVIKSPGFQKRQPVTYKLIVDGAELDPELIIDGEGLGVPPLKKKAGKKKAAKKR